MNNVCIWFWGEVCLEAYLGILSVMETDGRTVPQYNKNMITAERWKWLQTQQKEFILI